MDEDSREILIRNPQDYPESLKVTLDILTINETPTVVGSAAYLNHKYPSDVDVFERTTANLSRIDAISFYAKQFRNIMEKIIVSPKIFYMDFKVGRDYRYDIYVSKDNTDEREKVMHQLVEKNLLNKERSEEHTSEL